MRYSDIEKCCNSSRTKVPSLHVQSCLRDCYRASEVESLLIEVVVVVRLQGWCKPYQLARYAVADPGEEPGSLGNRFIFRRK